jgi:hypothetical protein
MEFEHKKFGKCVVKDINQKELEDFSNDMTNKEKVPLTVWRGDSVRAAVKHGILVEPALSLDDVDNAKPGLIVWLADCVNKVIAEALSIDPLS